MPNDWIVVFSAAAIAAEEKEEEVEKWMKKLFKVKILVVTLGI